MSDMVSQSQNFIYLEGLTLQQLETIAILRALDQNKWNRTKAAKSLGISVRTLFNKITLMQMRKPSDQHLR